MKSALYRFNASKYTNDYFGTQACKTCTSCAEEVCTCLPFASYDINNNILIPSGTYYWQYAPPKYIHPTACTFKIEIAGFSAKDITESWFQDIDKINGTYYHLVSAHQRRFSPQCLFCTLPTDSKSINYAEPIYTPFCNFNLDPDLYDFCLHADPIVGGFKELECYFLIGADDPNNPCNSTIYPSGLFYHYYNRDKDLEGRPQLYIWAKVILHLNSVQNTQNNNYNGPYTFMKNIGEFNGDYEILSNQVYPLESTECGEKFYHGNFDGRNFTFTVSDADLIGSPIKVCNFGTITISTVSNDLPYDVNNYSTLADTFTPRGSYHAVGKRPDYLIAHFDGVYSANPLPPESGDPTACSDCENGWNTAHLLPYTFYYTHDPNPWTSDPWAGSYNFVKIFQEPICGSPCEYNAYGSVAPSSQTLNTIVCYFSASGNPSDATQTRLVLNCDIYGSAFGDGIGLNDRPVISYYGLASDWFQNPEYIGGSYSYCDRSVNIYYPTLYSSVNMSLQTNLDYHASLGCQFENSTLNIEIGNMQKEECDEQIAGYCMSCADRNGPLEYVISIPNGWTTFSVSPYACCADAALPTMYGTYFLQQGGGYNILYPTAQCAWEYSTTPHDCGPSLITLNIFKFCKELYSNCEDYCFTFCSDNGHLIISVGSSLLWDGGKGGTNCINNSMNKYLAIVTMGIGGKCCDIYPTWPGCSNLTRDGVLAWGAIIGDPSNFGTSIQNGTTDCDSTDPMPIGGQYINCNISNLSLQFLGHYVNGGYIYWGFPFMWNGSPLTLSAVT